MSEETNTKVEESTTEVETPKTAKAHGEGKQAGGKNKAEAVDLMITEEPIT